MDSGQQAPREDTAMSFNPEATSSNETDNQGRNKRKHNDTDPAPGSGKKSKNENLPERQDNDNIQTQHPVRITAQSTNPETDSSDGSNNLATNRGTIGQDNPDFKQNATDLLSQTGQQGTFRDIPGNVPFSSVTVDALAFEPKSTKDFELSLSPNRTPHPQTSWYHRNQVITRDMIQEPSVLENEFPCYKMDARQRGICLIINNREFYNGPCEPRLGTEFDAEKLKTIFEKLRFEVRMTKNLTDSEMTTELKNIADTDHRQYDCFVCCILSHGSEDKVFGSNSKPVKIGYLTTMLQPNMCTTLAGKPKIFFIKACQGEKKDVGSRIQIDGPTDNERSQLIPTESDFLLGYSTVRGYVSYRDTKEGSAYIEKLVDVLTTYHKRMDLLSILTKVNDEVSKMIFEYKGLPYKQMPKFESTLRKKLIFS